MHAGSLSSLVVLLAGTTVASPLLGASTAAGLGSRQLGSRQDDTPSVDLGYEVHTATVNETGDYYIFSNIPYADQPVGDNRFQQVSLPSGGNSSTVNNGSTDYICYQAYPEWIIEISAESNGVSTEVMEEILYSQSGQTEACLYLDVYVPTGIFNGNSSSKAPVLVWVHGGGFTYGSKTSYGSPAGIISRSTLNDSEGVIFVSINYRLGLFGWLGGGGITPNLGLYDQQVAFNWVKEYIGLFGGDADQITVLGESAGGSSILHHVTSYGGENPDPLAFSRAIIQSPAFQFNLNLTEAYVQTLDEASDVTGDSVTTAADLSSLDAETLRDVNFQTVLPAPQGYFVYGPAPDGTFVPALPEVLLAEGRFDDSVAVMTSHTSLEAAPFVPSNISTEADLIAQLQSSYPEASNETLTHILDVLYPAEDYSSQFLRGVQIASDADFSCSTRYLGVAFRNETYNILFAYPPGYHGEDNAYTFFNGDTSSLNDGYPVDPDLAYALQDYIVGFALSGDPNGSPAGPTLEFPLYGSNATVVEFEDTGLVTAHDDMDNDRCPWWQQAMIDGTV